MAVVQGVVAQLADRHVQGVAPARQRADLLVEHRDRAFGDLLSVEVRPEAVDPEDRGVVRGSGKAVHHPSGKAGGEAHVREAPCHSGIGGGHDRDVVPGGQMPVDEQAQPDQEHRMARAEPSGIHDDRMLDVAVERQVVAIAVAPAGGAAQLDRQCHRAIIADGPAGTGETVGATCAQPSALILRISSPRTRGASSLAIWQVPAASWPPPP